MNRKNILMVGAVWVLSVCAFAPKANAVPVTPGGPAVALGGTTSAARPDLAGVVVVDVVRPFSIKSASATMKGWVEDRVVRCSQTGTLDFYYRIYLDPSSTASLVRVIRYDFWGGPTDCDWRIDGLGQRAPESVWRTSGGEFLYFEHSNTGIIHPGEQSRFVLVKTKATSYSEGYMGLGYNAGWPNAAFVVPGFQPEY